MAGFPWKICGFAGFGNVSEPGRISSQNRTGIIRKSKENVMERAGFLGNWQGSETSEVNRREACVKQEQKELIRSLRLQGWGYKRIAKALRLNRNQVQLYCKTHGLAGAGEFVKLNLPIWYEQNDRCIICGEKLDRKQRGRTKRFCSGKCRTKYYRAKKQEEEEAHWL